MVANMRLRTSLKKAKGFRVLALNMVALSSIKIVSLTVKNTGLCK